MNDDDDDATTYGRFSVPARYAAQHENDAPINTLRNLRVIPFTYSAAIFSAWLSPDDNAITHCTYGLSLSAN